MIEEHLKENYWRLIARTRKSGRISPSVVRKVEEGWKAFDEDVVKEALSVHVQKYQNYKENYTLGIMRNMQKQKALTGKVKKQDIYNNFMKRDDYDMDSLERELLGDMYDLVEGKKNEEKLHIE